MGSGLAWGYMGMLHSFYTLGSPFGGLASAGIGPLGTTVLRTFVFTEEIIQNLVNIIMCT